MSDIILWSLLAFFSAFGLLEFIRFLYADFKSRENDYYLVVHSEGMEEDIECIVRNAILSTDCHSVIILTQNSSVITNKLAERYPHITFMTTEDYIEHLKQRRL